MVVVFGETDIVGVVGVLCVVGVLGAAKDGGRRVWRERQVRDQARGGRVRARRA